MNFSASLVTQGKSTKELRQSMSGQVPLRGKNLTLVGGDLDGRLSRFGSSQNSSTSVR
jgi:hypothetical protein